MNTTESGKQSSSQVTIYEMTRIGVFTAMAIAAAVLVRFGGSVVPFSLLPLVMCLAGGILGPRPGAYSMLAYMLLGLMGLPVFASPPYGGLAYVFTPSFGFVPGFVLGAYAVGVVSRKARPQHNLPKAHMTALLFTANTVGVLVYYAIGLPYLGVILNVYYGQPTSVIQVLKIGFMPFIVPDLIKAFAAAAITRAVIGSFARRLACRPASGRQAM